MLGNLLQQMLAMSMPLRKSSKTGRECTSTTEANCALQSDPAGQGSSWDRRPCIESPVSLMEELGRCPQSFQTASKVSCPRRPLLQTLANSSSKTLTTTLGPAVI